MSMNVTGDYSRFCIGSEPLKSYGLGGEGLSPKDTLVKYVFNTTDEYGNKVMEPMSKEESLRVMEEISSSYGDNVLVEFSGDGLQALSQSLQNQIKKGDWKQLTEEQKAERARKQELLEQSIVHLENTHRLIIPNIQTNEKLYGSLENAPEQVVKAANGIIKNYLLPHDVSGMSEAQRRDAIAFGLEEARYLADNYLDEQHGKDFLSAMETIARYGMGGTVSEDGKVAYHIEWGPMVGAPDDCVRESDILKAKAPELYKELQELNQNIVKGQSGWGRKFIELQNRIHQKLNSRSGTWVQGRELTYYEEAAYAYQTWKKSVDSTALPDTYSDVDRSDITALFDSLRQQGSLGESWFDAAQERFTKWLATD